LNDCKEKKKHACQRSSRSLKLWNSENDLQIIFLRIAMLSTTAPAMNADVFRKPAHKRTPAERAYVIEYDELTQALWARWQAKLERRKHKRCTQRWDSVLYR